MIYVGLSPSGRIHGVKMDRKERDRLCMDIDRMMKNGFNPCIKHNQYKVYICLHFEIETNECVIASSKGGKCKSRGPPP